MAREDLTEKLTFAQRPEGSMEVSKEILWIEVEEIAVQRPWGMETGVTEAVSEEAMRAGK